MCNFRCFISLGYNEPAVFALLQKRGDYKGVRELFYPETMDTYKHGQYWDDHFQAALAKAAIYR